MKFKVPSAGTVIATGALVLAASGVSVAATGALANGSVGTAQLKRGAVTNPKIHQGAITGAKLSGNVRRALNAKSVPGPKGDKGDTGATGAAGPKGATGATGPQGAPGDNELAGAYYSVAYYDAGDTNGGAIATVACKAQTDTAISGGVSVDDYTKNVPVGQSFPGRMDFTTNTPKPGRLDGWIVQFASQNGSAPEKVKVWALCVPGLNVPVDQTFTESSS